MDLFMFICKRLHRNRPHKLKTNFFSSPQLFSCSVRLTGSTLWYCKVKRGKATVLCEFNEFATCGTRHWTRVKEAWTCHNAALVQMLFSELSGQACRWDLHVAVPCIPVQPSGDAPKSAWVQCQRDWAVWIRSPSLLRNDDMILIMALCWVHCLFFFFFQQLAFHIWGNLVIILIKIWDCEKKSDLLMQSTKYSH